MTIRVWRPGPQPIPQPAPKSPPQKPPKVKQVPPPLTRDQIKKAKRKEENRALAQQASEIYRALREGIPAEEIIAKGFEPKWVYRYLLIHAKKYRLWRQAIALFESGVSPQHALFRLEVSPTKLGNWYVSWREHGPGLPVVIPTGCEGIE